LSAAVLTFACGEASERARAERERADSIRALGAAAWTDDELVAYIRLISATLIADAPVVDRKSRSRAVRAFGRSVVSDHQRLDRIADSVALGDADVIPPSVSSEILQQHERELRRLEQTRDFDLGYVNTVRNTLTEARTQLLRAAVKEGRAPEVVRLSERASIIARDKLRTANELRRNLDPARQERTPPAVKGATSSPSSPARSKGAQP
jgi:predicted outer membrane protein